MKLPKRIETHVTETKSWRLLQSVAPAEWVVREVSERDYGIDCYVEVASKDGHITGELVSAQLKGVEQIEWEGKAGDRSARGPSIKTSTANYWLNLPVPVFLLVADLAAKKVHYAAVKNEIRKNYDKLETQDSISFRLHEELHLESDIGKALFAWCSNTERHHQTFSFHVTNLLSQIGTFVDFIRENQNRDSFMEVEEDRHLQFRALYESYRIISIFLDPKSKVKPLSALYKKDRAEWKDDYVLLHEQTLDAALQELELDLPKVVRAALKLVTETQASYWRARDPVFVSLCWNAGIDWRLKELEKK